MAQCHNNPLVGEERDQTIASEHEQEERTPLLRIKKNKKRKSLLSRLKDRVFVKSKAANMILLWNLLVSLIYGSGLGMFPSPNTALSSIAQVFGGPAVLALQIIIPVSAYSYFAICLLFYPLAGYLGDVRFGRYKTVRCSLWTIWTAVLTIAVCCTICIPIVSCTDLLMSPHWLWVLVACAMLGGLVVLITILTGFAGFRANVIQFGMDQLQDSPATDSSLFVFWFLITFYFGIGLGKLGLSFMLINIVPFVVMYSVAGLTFLIVTPISLCVGHCKRRWFFPTPGIVNPYKLVRQVTSFARQHKVPVHRSAFTYWEEDVPSGLDLGKNKYGGPFTTEQVEDVKAFFGILKVLLSLGPFFMADFAASDFLSVLGYHMGGTIQGSSYVCYYGFMTANGGTFYPLFTVLMILLYTLMPQRYIQKYTPGMLKRIGIGLLLITVSLICSLSMDTAGHSPIGNPNATCIFGSSVTVYNYSISPLADQKVQTLDISPYFLLIQNILTAAAYILIYGGTFEFICAQSPHSMKGFLIGVLFAIKGLFQLLGVLVVFLPFNFWHFTINFPSCGFGYYLVNIIISIIGVIAFTYAAKKYQYRQRDEFCDERQYIEEFYENVVNHNPPPDPDD